MKSIAFALLLAACATSDEAADPIAREETYEIVPVELAPQRDKEGNPMRGTLEIDTSKGRMDLTPLIPEKPREFGSWDEFHGWATETLNAVIVETEKGERVTQLAANFGPTVRYDASVDDMVPVDDPIQTIIGGLAGYIYVGGELYCMNGNAECTAKQTVPSLSVWNHIPHFVQQSNNGLIVSGASNITHLFALHEIKASTSQVYSSTFSTRTFWCGFFRWCTATVGSNTLTASFTSFRSTGSIFNGSPPRAVGVNTTAVAATLFGFGVSVSGTTDGSYRSVGPGNAGYISDTDSMCSSHSGNDGKGFVGFPTMAGYHPFGGC